MPDNAKSSRLSFLLTLLSFFCIGLGIISIIASNWQEISAIVKLGADIMLLAATAAALVRAYYKKPQRLTPLSIFYALLIAASIGLVAQVFQLSSHSFSSVAMLWCLLTAPLLLLNSAMVFPFFWLPLFFTASFNLWVLPWLTDKPFSDAMLYDSSYYFCWVLLYSVISLFINNQHGLVRALRFWTVAGICFFFLQAGLTGVLGNIFYSRTPEEHASLLPVALMVLLWGGIFILSRRQNKSFLLPAITALQVCYVISLAVFHVYDRYFDLAVSLAALAILAAYAYVYNHSKLLVTAVILMAIRIFVLFLELFGSLMNTGIILISGGLFLIVSVKICKLLVEKSHA